MTKTFCLLLALISSIVLLGNNIEMRLVQSAVLASKPGVVNNFSIALWNKGSNSTRVRPQLNLPEGWKSITNSASFSLEAGAKALKIISFVIPSKALAGTYEITYRLSDYQNPTVEFIEKIKIEVAVTNALKLIPLSTSSTLLAGTTINGQFLVKNNSNQPQTILLSSRNATLKGASSIELSAFSSQRVIIETSTFSETRKESRVSIDLKATIKGSGISETAYLHNQVLPSTDQEIDNTRKLPGYASLNYILRQFSNGRKGQGWQGELFLQGTIDEQETKEVTLNLRGPNQQDGTELTLYDQYFASYRTSKFSILAGDNNYALSTLTEFSRNGRGIQTEGYFGSATVGAFFVKPRFFTEIKQEVGIFIQNEFNHKTNIRFNYLHKDNEANNGTASILSLSGQFSPLKNTFVLGEIASGNSGQAGYLKIQTKLFDRLQLNGDLIYASPNFAGYFQNTLNLISNASFRVTKKVSILAGIFQNTKNAALDTLINAAPFSDRKHIGLNWRLAKNSNIQLNIRQNEIEDRLPQKQFFRKESIVTANVNHRVNRFNFSLTGEYGQSENLLQAREADFQEILRVFLDVGVKIRHISIRGFGQYYNENSLQVSTQKQFLFGGTISGTIKDHTQFKIRYQNDFEAETYYKNRNAFDLFLTHTIRKNQQLILNARQTIQRNTLNNRDFFFSAKYLYQFGIRLEPKPPKGAVYGQIQRKNGQSPAGIIVLLNGKRAITDEEGRFQFRSVQPGKYPLILDPSSLALHEILADNEVQMVEVLPEVNQLVRLELIQSGSILGGIQFQEDQSKAQLISLQTVGNLMLEVSNEHQIRRTFTDDNGQYKFGDIKPGKWKVKVLQPDLGRHLKIRQTEFTIDVKEGEAVDLPIIIQKKKRNIQFKQLIQLSDDDG